MKDYQKALNGFADRLKSEPVYAPIQQVNPVAKILKEKEVQLNVELPKSVLKAIKAICLEQDLKIKQFVILAIEKEIYNFQQGTKIIEKCRIKI